MCDIMRSEAGKEIFGHFYLPAVDRGTQELFSSICMLPLQISEPHLKRDGTIVACSDQPFRASGHLSVAINTFRLSNYTLTRESKYLKCKMVTTGPNLVHMYTDVHHGLLYICNNESETICLFLVVAIVYAFFWS